MFALDMSSDEVDMYTGRFSSAGVNRYLSLASWGMCMQLVGKYGYFICIVSAAVLYYDYALTLSMEYEQFWKHQSKFSTAAVLFVLNRYLSLLGEIPIVYYMFASLASEVSTAFISYQSRH